MTEHNGAIQQNVEHNGVLRNQRSSKQCNTACQLVKQVHVDSDGEASHWSEDTCLLFDINGHCIPSELSPGFDKIDSHNCQTNTDCVTFKLWKSKQTLVLVLSRTVI